MMRNFLYMLLAIALLWGCGGTQTYEKPDYSGYSWPPPPYPPKVKLINIVNTDLDIRGLTSSESLFGERTFFAFKKPHGVTVDMHGNVLVSDSYMNTVFVLDTKNGNVGNLHNPYGWYNLAGLASDNVTGLIGAVSGNSVYVFDQKAQKIQMTLGPNQGLERPAGVAFDPNRKRIYITDAKLHQVHAYGYDGKHIKMIADDTEVYYPLGIAVHPNGKIYVVDSMHFRIVVFNPDLSYDTAFGEHGDFPGMFARPKDIAISNEGMLFITDAAFGNFQIFHPDGRIFGYVGMPGSGFGRFNQPQGIAVGEDDTIYVVDQTNRRLQVFQYLSDRYLQSHPEDAAEVEKAWEVLRQRRAK